MTGLVLITPAVWGWLAKLAIEAEKQRERKP
jgi:hypothetical protein